MNNFLDLFQVVLIFHSLGGIVSFLDTMSSVVTRNIVVVCRLRTRIGVSATHYHINFHTTVIQELPRFFIQE